MILLGKNARKKTNNEWFETQDGIAYMDIYCKQVYGAGYWKQGAWIFNSELLYTVHCTRNPKNAIR